MEDEEFGEGLSVTSSMIRQPLPASLDLEDLSENSVQFVDDDSVPVHLPESLNFAHGFHVPDFEDKPCDSDFQNGSVSIPGVDLAGLKARREQEGNVPVNVGSGINVGSSVLQEQVDLGSIDRMISDAQVHVAETSLKLPWELPCYENLFFESAVTLPKVTNTLSSYENPSRDTSASAPSLSGNMQKAECKPVLFESAVSFKQGRTRAVSHVAQFDLLTQRWECVVGINCTASSVGKHLLTEERPARLVYVSECLGGKSLSTVRKRLGQVVKYLKWAESDTFQCPLPFTYELVHGYVKSVIDNGAGYSSVNGFMECIRFMHHVLGFEAPSGLLQDPWIAGKLRKLKQERPLRKQSRTLTVRELVHLECFLSDGSRSIVDRYAAGCILFGTYSRSRVGDLACIEQYIMDVHRTDHGHVGYIELHTSSHKTRATSNALGLNLALVAPIRGLGPLEWGMQFIEVAKKAGLPLDKRALKEPLLPAPSLEGGWSNRPISSKEVKLWLHAMLTELPDFCSDNLTGHCIKASTLSMLSRYGASEEVRMVLGHHSMRNKSSLEAYSRDIQAYPLRVLEEMFRSIRLGGFCPDNTRSGIVQKLKTPVVREPSHTFESADGAGGKHSMSSATAAVGEEDGLLDEEIRQWLVINNGSEQREGECKGLAFGESTDELEAPSKIGADKQEFHEGERQAGSEVSPDSSSSSSEDSGTSDDELLMKGGADRAEVVEWRQGCTVHQHRKTKTLHLLPTGSHELFICGRKVGPETPAFRGGIQTVEWRCKQCDRGKPIRHLEGMVDAFDAALKRVKRN